MPSTVESQVEFAEKEWLRLWKKGPSRIRWSKVPLQVGDQAPDFQLLQDASGKTGYI